MAAAAPARQHRMGRGGHTATSEVSDTPTRKRPPGAPAASSALTPPRAYGTKTAILMESYCPRHQIPASIMHTPEAAGAVQ